MAINQWLIVFIVFLYRYVVDGHFSSKQHTYSTKSRLVTGARLISVQVNQTPGLYAGTGVYPGPGFCPKFYGLFILLGQLLVYLRCLSVQPILRPDKLTIDSCICFDD